MVRNDLENIPNFLLPAGFTLRLFQEDDIENWARVETAAGEFTDVETGIARFTSEFGAFTREMKERCLFLENQQGEVIGTATAWYGRLDETGKEIGRIHWVGIIPKYQGKGLAKPLLSAALKLLQNYHQKAYLTSQTTSYRAINLYLNYGFQAVQTTPNWQKAWLMMEEMLHRKIITE